MAYAFPPLRSVTVKRNAAGLFGFSVAGVRVCCAGFLVVHSFIHHCMPAGIAGLQGVENDTHPAVELTPGGKVVCTQGDLQPNDILVKINNIVVLGALHLDVINAIKMSEDHVLLDVARDVPPALHTISGMLKAKITDAATLALRDQLRDHLYTVRSQKNGRMERMERMEGKRSK